MITKDIINQYLIFSEKKQRVVILADSLSMPRLDESESLLYEETYPFLLAKELCKEFEVINRGKRGNTTLAQSSDQCFYDDILFMYPKFVIVQLGIVDCAPRLFSKRFGKYVIGNIHPLFLRNFIVRQFSQHRFLFTKYFPIQYVTINKFAFSYDYLLSTIQKFGSVPIVVNIARTSLDNEKRSFGYQQHIKNYNRIILETSLRYQAIHIDMHLESENNEILLPDGIHYNQLGSKIVAARIASEIKNYTAK